MSKKQGLTQRMKSEMEKTGEYREPDPKSGISGISTKAFLSSALLVTIGFGIRDGFFRIHSIEDIWLALILLALNFVLALILIVSGVVIYQTIGESKKADRNMSIYWFVLILGAAVLILIL